MLSSAASARPRHRSLSNCQSLQRDLLFHLTNVRQSLAVSAGTYNGMGGVVLAPTAGSSSASTWRLVWMELHETEKIFIQDLEELETLCEEMCTAYVDRQRRAAKHGHASIPSLLRRVTTKRPARSSSVTRHAATMDTVLRWRALFAMFAEIRAAHRQLCDTVLQPPSNHSADADESSTFLQLVTALQSALPDVFPLHQRYSHALAVNVQTLKSLMDDADFAACWTDVLAERRAQHPGVAFSWSLEWALAKPLHRLIKYPLIFGKWSACSALMSDQRVNDAVRELIATTHTAVKQIDVEKGQDDAAERLRELDAQVTFKHATDYEGKNRKGKGLPLDVRIDDGNRRLLLEAEFKHIVSHAKDFLVSPHPLHLFLLSDALLVGERVLVEPSKKHKRIDGPILSILHPPIPLSMISVQAMPDCCGLENVIQLKVGASLLYNISAPSHDLKDRLLLALDGASSGGDTISTHARVTDGNKAPEGNLLFNTPCKVYYWNADKSAWAPMGHCRMDIYADPAGDGGLIIVYAIPVTGRTLFHAQIVPPSFPYTIQPDPRDADVDTTAPSRWYQVNMHLFGGDVAARSSREVKAVLVSLKIKDRSNALNLKGCLDKICTVEAPPEVERPASAQPDDDDLLDDGSQSYYSARQSTSFESTVVHREPQTALDNVTDDTKASKYVVEQPMFSGATFESATSTNDAVQNNADRSTTPTKSTFGLPKSEKIDSCLSAAISLSDIEVHVAGSRPETPSAASVDWSELESPLSKHPDGYERLADERDTAATGQHSRLHSARSIIPILHTRRSSLMDSYPGQRTPPKFTADDEKELVNWVDKLLSSAAVKATMEKPVATSDASHAAPQPRSLVDNRLDRAQKQLQRLKEWVDTVCADRSDHAATGLRILRKLEHELCAIQRLGAVDTDGAH